MTSQQSRLTDTDGEPIAEQLAESQRSISIAEFFEKNKQMLGFDSGAKALVTAVKEATDNALDATEEAGVLPDIYIEIEEVGDYYRLVVEDNGPGITKEQIPKVFGKLLYGSRFHKREQSLTPDQIVLIKRKGEIEFIPIGVLCDAFVGTTGEGTARLHQDIQVPSFSRADHSISWQPLTHVIKHKTAEETYTITTETGASVAVTGNHSLFSVTAAGETQEIRADNLNPGDAILAPTKIPELSEPKDTVNLLTELSQEQLEPDTLFVTDISTTLLTEIKSAEIFEVENRSTPGLSEKYYRYHGTRIDYEKFHNEFLPKRYLPAETVIALKWEEKCKDCSISSSPSVSDNHALPVTVDLTKSLIHAVSQFLGYSSSYTKNTKFIETLRSESFTGNEIEQLNGNSQSAILTTSRQVYTYKVILETICGRDAEQQRIPSFVFTAPSEYRDVFIQSLIPHRQGNDADSVNQKISVTNETLARQIVTLFKMQGTHACMHRIPSASSSSTETTPLESWTIETHNLNPGKQTEIPVSILDSIAISNIPDQTVPDTIQGLLYGCGVGDNLAEAIEYQKQIESLLNSNSISDESMVTKLREWGLLDTNREPTPRLLELWESIHSLHGITATDMSLIQVRDIEKTTSPEYVYDISVPGKSGHDENFIVLNEGALSVRNSRGQQGIGISAAVLYSQLTSGKAAKITSKTQNGESAKYFELTIDTESNEPEIDVEEETQWDRPHGTRIELEMEANMRARSQLHEYVQNTAVVNPHARVEFHEPDTSMKFERATEELPPETSEIRPHPHGVELGTLLKMLDASDSYSLSGFLQNEFTRVGAKTANEILDRFRDRYYGRDIAWRVQHTTTESNLADTLISRIIDAVANKSSEATTEFAERITGEITSYEWIAFSDIQSIVDDNAQSIETDFEETFGTTVRENTVNTIWEIASSDRQEDLYYIVDEATTNRKDDASVESMARRLANKFESSDEKWDRVTHKSLTEFVDRSADMTADHDDVTFGETARENIIEGIWNHAVRIESDLPNVSAVANDRDAAAQFLEAMRETDILAPPTDCLSPISSELVKAGLEKEYAADFFAATTRDAKVHGGDPFVVEAGIAYGGDLQEGESVDILRFANRVPLVYQRGACATVDVVKQINWRNYGLEQPGGSGLPSGPAVLMIHVASTNVPFTSESKDAIANIPEIEDEIELALRDAARDMKSYLNKKRSLEQRRRKQTIIADILPEMAKKIAEVTGRESLDIDDSLARIMNNVLVERSVKGTTVELTVANYGDTNVSPEITEIVPLDPGDLDDATVIEMDGEWFIKWAPTVGGGDRATLAYEISTNSTDDLSFEISVEGVEGEKLTINA